MGDYKKQDKLTNGVSWNTVKEDNETGCARATNTTHNPNPVLSAPVTGLQMSITNRGDSVSRENCGPADSGGISEGRFVVGIDFKKAYEILAHAYLREQTKGSDHD